MTKKNTNNKRNEQNIKTTKIFEIHSTPKRPNSNTKNLND